MTPIEPIGARKPAPVCWLCKGRREVKVFRGEPSQGHDWEPCELCCPKDAPQATERHKPMSFPEEEE